MRSCSDLANPRGSNPTSPARAPVSADGRAMNGMDTDIVGSVSISGATDSCGNDAGSSAESDMARVGDLMALFCEGANANDGLVEEVAKTRARTREDVFIMVCIVWRRDVMLGMMFLVLSLVVLLKLLLLI